MSVTSFISICTSNSSASGNTITVAAATTGDIRGTKFHDLDANGIHDNGEPGLEDWKIYIDANNNGQYDIGEPNTITDSNGDYEFLELTPDTYTIAEDPRLFFDTCQ